ncbi:Argininosuccinate lyase [Variovorax sp. PBS-H4]|uniref:Bug family tripartite tricarboxylate transporter substrate binding protein n=1 Tax=Variovorax sp. PBS-H4 TaxID=434008 RepID=UPI001317BD46|nr:tripartite tricarboxylate transporter substrate binding protein [Variovorax sp. PBS-H4]VTU36593.1 Argininosuccinate lyase [Variovorax sp. PBS-H4]
MTIKLFSRLRIGSAPRVAALFAAAAFASGALAQAGDYPNRPIRLISGFAAGGATDLVARIVAQSVTDALGQPVVVENKPGASGNIAAEMVARAPADGYVIYLCNATITMPAMFPKLRFDARKDFAPVALVAYGPSVLAVNPKFQVRSLRELIDYAARNPGKLDYASGGVGNITHMAMELLVSMTGMKVNHVPYKGGGPSTLAAVGGEVPVVMAAISNVVGHVKQGTLVPLGISGHERSKALPDVPTIAEAGVPGYEASSWYGILAPAGTPKPVVDKLQQAISAGVAKAEWRDKLTVQGIEPAPMDPERFAKLIDSETRKWNEIVVRNHITAE